MHAQSRDVLRSERAYAEEWFGKREQRLAIDDLVIECLVGNERPARQCVERRRGQRIAIHAPGAAEDRLGRAEWPPGETHARVEIVAVAVTETALRETRLLRGENSDGGRKDGLHIAIAHRGVRHHQ